MAVALTGLADSGEEIAQEVCWPTAVKAMTLHELTSNLRLVEITIHVDFAQSFLVILVFVRAFNRDMRHPAIWFNKTYVMSHRKFIHSRFLAVVGKVELANYMTRSV